MCPVAMLHSCGCADIGFAILRFQLATTIGIFAASLIKYGAQISLCCCQRARKTVNLLGLTPALLWPGQGPQSVEAEWRVSLGFAMWPALFIGVGCLTLKDTLNSILQRNPDDVQRVRKVRGHCVHSSGNPPVLHALQPL